MAIRDTLGFTGRSGGKDDRCRSVGLRLIPVSAGVRFSEKLFEWHNALYPGGIETDDEIEPSPKRIAKPIKLRRVRQHQTREVAAASYLANVRVNCIGVEADGNTARGQDPELGEVPLAATRRHDANPCASGHAELPETIAEGGHRLAVATPGGAQPLPAG